MAITKGAGIMSSALLSSFTPSLMKAEDLEALFVQREELAQRLVDLIRESTVSDAKHHHLLIGPRGIGKTHIVALTYYRIQAMEDLRDKLLVAWMREEEWGVNSFLDLLLRIFRALVEEYQDSELDLKVQALYPLSPKDAEYSGTELLKEYVGDRTLLILGENWDDLFSGLGDKGQKRLRSYLQENPFCSIVATAQGLFNGVKLQTSPFYGFFHVSHLEGLSLDEATKLLANIAKVTGKADLASALVTPLGRARVRAVHHLAGGNHRVYVIFSQFLTRESLDELVQPFMKTLDELTPYYQARMQWLSPQQRKIIEFLCDRRRAVPVKGIAQQCFMTHQTTSGQLKHLRDMGYVESQVAGRESYYELREPLMRLCIEVKKNRGEPISLLVDFLRMWFSQAELQKKLSLLSHSAIVEREYLLYTLHIISQEEKDPRIEACRADHSLYVREGNFSQALKAAEELTEIRGWVSDWLDRGHCLVHLQKGEEALGSFEKALELDPENAQCWRFKGWGLGFLERWEDALECLDHAILIDPNDQIAWFYKADALNNLERCEEALDAFDKVVELRPEDASGWYERGYTLSRLGRSEEALESLDQVIRIDPDAKPAWCNRGGLLDNLGRYDEALESFDEAIKRGPSDAHLWIHKGDTFSTIKRWDKAQAAYNKAIELGEESPIVFFALATALSALGYWDGVFAALRKALSRSDDDPSGVAYSGIIVQNLFLEMQNEEICQEHVSSLVGVYGEYNQILMLASGLMFSIPEIVSLRTDISKALKWWDTWYELVENKSEFDTPLRLLSTTIRYKEKKDKKFLLELSVEERSLLKPLLVKGEEVPQAEMTISKKTKKRKPPSQHRRRK